MLDAARLSLKTAERYDAEAGSEERVDDGWQPTLRECEMGELQLAQTQALIGILEALTEGPDEPEDEPGCVCGNPDCDLEFEPSQDPDPEPDSDDLRAAVGLANSLGIAPTPSVLNVLRQLRLGVGLRETA